MDNKLISVLSLAIMALGVGTWVILSEEDSMINKGPYRPFGGKITRKNKFKRK